VLQDLDPLRRHPLFHAGGRMDRRVVPVEPPLLCGHGGPLLLKMLHEGAQDLDGVGGVDRGAPGDDMGIDHPRRIEKRHDHLLGATGVDPGLQRARLTPWDPLLTLFFRFRRVIGDHGFVHGDDRVQHSLGSAVHGGDEVGTDPDPLLFLFLTQQLGDPSGRLLFKAEILVQDVENGFLGDPMGGGDRLHRQATIFLDGGSDRGDQFRSSHCLLRIQMAHVGGGFAGLHLLNNGVDRRRRRRRSL
jgi:hypothetical protein